MGEDHEDGFHADGAVGDVGCGEADGDEQVGALAGFGNEAAQRDGVGREAADLDIALVFHEAVAFDAAAVMGIHGVGSQTDGIFGDFVAGAIVLGHDIV